MRILMVLTLAAIIAFVALKSCGGTVGDNPQYKQLDVIMNERAHLWTTPRSEGGTRARDISDIVCPAISESDLNEMFADRKILSNISYDYFEDGKGIYPDNTKRWIIRKRINLSSTGVLAIELAPNNYCYVGYNWN